MAQPVARIPDATGFDVDTYFDMVEQNAFIPEPPKERVYIGDGDFRRNGCDIARAIIKLAGLAPDAAVLDIGSGIGRLALPLTQWLTPQGRYLGVEIVTEGVSWCIENITAKYPNFRFIHADLWNNYYNPTGQGSSAAFRLPDPDGTFDVAAFASVFTHLDATDADAWLGHVAKALRPGGHVWSTWFIMDEETTQNCAAGKATISLSYTEDGVYWQTAEKDVGAVGFAPWKMAEMFERHGFRIVQQTRGTWSNRTAPDGGYQDVTLLQKS